MYHGNPQCLGWKNTVDSFGFSPTPKKSSPQNPLRPTQQKKGWGVNLGNQNRGVKTFQPFQIIQPIFWKNDSPNLLGKTKKTDLLPKKLVLLSHKARTIAKGWSQHDLIGFFDEGISGSTTIFLDPKCSMYGIFTYIYRKLMVNVGKYSIHGAYGDGTLNEPEMRKNCSSQNGFGHLLP